MDADDTQPASHPVFTRCVRCKYALHGLPAEHACPECGLRFDERCALFPVTNTKQVLAVWVAIFTGGWVSLEHLPGVVNFAVLSAWRKTGVLAALVWFPLAIIGVTMLIRSYRRGFKVAITTDGLIVHLPGFSTDLISWNTVGGVSVKQVRKGKPQIATLRFANGRKSVNIGGVCNVFPTRADVDRFAQHVAARILV